jgi:GMP synthase-like glutamine amidotransferase
MKRILVLQHMACQNAGIFRRFATSHDIEFSEIDLYSGVAIPELNQFDGLWVMGGSMNAWETDEHPWMIDEIKTITEVITDDTMPFLDIMPSGRDTLREVAERYGALASIPDEVNV